jgi:hypothetical protein
MNPVLLDWIGYIASAIVLISLLMNSIVKLRWINLIGAFVFGVYGFMIGSLPTGFMNVGIVLIDVYYLGRIYFTKEYFTILNVDKNSNYLPSFLEFYKEDISLLGKVDDFVTFDYDVRLYILRNMEIAGVFLASKIDNDTLEIKLDFAIPRYRDFKLGKYLFDVKKDYFINNGYSKFIAYGTNQLHIRYLEKMGFKKVEDHYEKSI